MAVRLLALLILVPVTAGCTGPRDGATGSSSSQGVGASEPCPDGATVYLGAPFRGQRYAEFTTSGGVVYVTVRKFRTGGVLDAPRGTSEVTVGDIRRPPAFDEQASAVRNTVASAIVDQGAWMPLELEAGTYWLWSSQGWDVAVRSCSPDGVSDPVPVPLDGGSE